MSAAQLTDRLRPLGLSVLGDVPVQPDDPVPPGTLCLALIGGSRPRLSSHLAARRGIRSLVGRSAADAASPPPLGCWCMTARGCSSPSVARWPCHLGWASQRARPHRARPVQASPVEKPARRRPSRRRATTCQRAKPISPAQRARPVWTAASSGAPVRWVRGCAAPHNQRFI